MKKIVLSVAIIIAVIFLTAFLFAPRTYEISLTARCYDCGKYKLPLTEETFDNLDFMDVNYEVKVTQNAFFITDINGYFTIGNTKYDVGDYKHDSHDSRHHCSLKDENGHIDYIGLSFSEDLASIMFFYNDGKYDEDKRGAWLGPCNSYNELIKALDDFGMEY